MAFKEVFLNHLQRQYGYNNLSHLLMEKAKVWDKFFGDFSKRVVEEIIDINTCVPSALDYFWGRIYKITRSFTLPNGSVLTLTDDEFREVIKIKQFGSRWDGTIGQMNEFLQGLFKDRGSAYMQDAQNMTVEIFVFDFPLTANELYLFQYMDILPRPAGVWVDIFETGKGQWFGFATYDQTFYNPTTVGFGTYDDEQEGGFATYNSDI